MRSVWNVIEVAHTRQGYPIVSIIKSFVDGEDKCGRFKTGYEKAYNYLEFLEENTHKRIYEITEFKYGQ